jgi:hypothetical protein
LIILIILEKSTSYEAPHYAAFSSLLSLHPSLVQYSSQHPVLKHRQQTRGLNDSKHYRSSISS